MPLFRRRPTQYEWAGPLEGAELDAFLRDLRADLDARGWRYEIGADALHVSQPQPRTLGLGNLAQTYHAVDAAERGDVIPVHFDNLLSADAEELPEDFEAVRPLLRVRLVAPDYLAGAAAPHVTRPLAEDLMAVLAIDTPVAVHMPTRESVEHWGRDEDELFDLGLAAVHAEEGSATQAFDVEGARLTALAGDSFYTATWAVWADELDPPAAGHGTLVAVPHRHAVLAHAIRDVTAVAAIKHLVQIAERMYSEGPGSISPSVYWVRDGAFERLATAVTEQGVTFVPSDELMEVLNSLD